MARLIISFYLMLILSLGVLFIGFLTSMSLALPMPLSIQLNQQLTEGTLRLLNDEFQLYDEQQTQQQLERYQKVFGKDFSLLEYSALEHFTTEQHELIAKGKLVSEMIIDPVFIDETDDTYNDDNPYWFFYFKKTGSSKVWRVNYDIEIDSNFSIPSNNEEIPLSSKFINGMMMVIKTALTSANTTPVNLHHKQKTVITKIKNYLDTPIQILDIKDINIDSLKSDVPHKLSRRTAQNVYQYFEDNNHVSIVQRILNSDKAIKVGPFETSWFFQHINHLLIISALLGLLSTFLFWIWPLWSNLIKIKRAADKFGKGIYSTRIMVGKFSPVKTIANAFNAMAKQTEDSIRAQKELTSSVSHELRTPIARIHFSVETLEHTDNDEEKIESISDIKEDIAELNSLIEELLHYARYDQQEIEISLVSTNIIEWFQHTMERLEPLSREKLQYKVSAFTQNEMFFIDARLLSRVLDNLVQNALRYATNNVVVTLTKNKSNLLLIVEDDGEGIPKDKRQQIFEAFSRIDTSRNRKTGGYGLGLAIVDRIVKAHNGSIIIDDSKMLEGALFKVIIPM